MHPLRRSARLSAARWTTIAATLFAGLFSLSWAITSTADARYATADEEGFPRLDRIDCGKGNFWDPKDGGGCWTCSGSVRTLSRVDGPTACTRPVEVLLTTADPKGNYKLSCPPKSFPNGDPLDALKDRSVDCLQCTKGKPVPVIGSLAKACFTESGGATTTAEKAYDLSLRRPACTGRTFASSHNLKRCYQCPTGYSHNPALPANRAGVCFKPPKVKSHPARVVHTLTGRTCKQGEIFDPIDGGSCWQCQDGYVRSPQSVKSENACVKKTTLAFSEADPVREAKVTCSEYGDSAFFDLTRASCWSCPSSHPIRTLSAVDGDRACTTKACGGAGERPCYVFERSWDSLGACDSGLVVDPLKNMCVNATGPMCRSSLKLVKDLRREAIKLKAAGSASVDELKDRLPGPLIDFMKSAQEGIQKQSEALVAHTPASDLTAELSQRIAEEEGLARAIDLMGVISTLDLTDLLLDEKLVCSGDVQGLHEKLLTMLDSKVQKQLSTFGTLLIPTAQAASTGVLHPTQQTIAAIRPLAEYLDKHQITASVAVQVPMYRNGPVTVPGTFGVQLSTNVLDSSRTAVHFVAGFDVSGQASNEDDPLDLVKAPFTLGTAWATTDTCSLFDSDWTWGASIGLWGMFGIGLDCNLANGEGSGFSATVADLTLQQDLEQWISAESLTDYLFGPGAAKGTQNGPQLNFTAYSIGGNMATLLLGNSDAAAGTYE